MFKLRKQICLFLVVFFAVSACGCSNLNLSSKQENSAALSFTSVRSLIDYINENQDSSKTALDKLVSNNTTLTLYEPRFLPKKYKIEEIKVDGNEILLIYDVKKNKESSPGKITMSWDTSGNGKSKIKDLIKSSKNLSRIYSNLDVFLLENAESTDEKHICWEQENILFKAVVPQKIYDKILKNKDNFTNPSSLIKFELDKFDKAAKEDNGENSENNHENRNNKDKQNANINVKSNKTEL